MLFTIISNTDKHIDIVIVGEKPHILLNMIESNELNSSENHLISYTVYIYNNIHDITTQLLNHLCKISK